MASKYSKQILSAYRQIRAKGCAVTFTRDVPVVTDVAQGTVTEGTPLVTSGYAVILPASKGTSEAFDNRLEDKTLAKKRKRFLIVAAYGLTFIPESLDTVVFEGSTWEVVGCTPVNPDGDQPIILNIGVVDLGAEASEETLDIWTATGSMAAGRFAHLAVTLLDGTVAVFGGKAAYAVATVELFHPSLGLFSTLSPMNHSRERYCATRLQNGSVLLTGGVGDLGVAQNSAEVYSPVTQRCTLTGSMNSPRIFHTSTLLADGRVLITGGGNASFVALRSAEIYDPVTGTFTSVGDLLTPRTDHAATLLDDGRVLITGGDDFGSLVTPSAEVFNPSTGQFSAVGDMVTPRTAHTSTRLQDGKVLLCGGGAGGAWTPTVLAELFDPSTNQFSATGSMTGRRAGHVAVLLEDGSVLVAGGLQGINDVPVATAELFTADAFAPAANMSTARGKPAAALLDSGKVLVCGGGQIPNPGGGGYVYLARLSSAEVYSP